MRATDTDLRFARNGAVDGGEKRAGIRRSERSRDVSQRREVPAAAHVAVVRRRASASPARCVHQRNRAGLSLARVSLLGSARRASALEVGVVEQRAGATAARATGHRISSTESAPATCAARPATALHWRAHSCPAPQRTRRGVRVSTSAAHPIGQRTDLSAAGAGKRESAARGAVRHGAAQMQGGQAKAHVLPDDGVRSVEDLAVRVQFVARHEDGGS